MRDEHFKVQLFRFVDVLAVASQIERYHGASRRIFRRYSQRLRPFIDTGVRLARIVPWVSGRVLRWNVSGMARQFIAGKNPNDVMKTLRKRRAQKSVSLSIFWARPSSAKRRPTNTRRAVLICSMASPAKREAGPIRSKKFGAFPVVNLSVKISALYSQMNPADPADAIAHLAPKLRPILRRATRTGRVYQFRYGKLRAQKYHHRAVQNHLHRKRVQGLAARRHRHSSLSARCRSEFARSDQLGAARGTRFTVRLVKGAYWDYETIKSRQNGWDCPVYFQKPESDVNFEALTRVLLGKRIDSLPPRSGRTTFAASRTPRRFADELGDRSQPLRVSTALWNGWADQARAGRDGLSRSRILPGRRIAPWNVLPRKAVAREHFERRIFARKIFGERFRGGIAA